MKMLFVLLLLAPTYANATTYLCHVPANPERGLPISVDIDVSPDADGGMAQTVANGAEKPLGFVKITRLDRSSPAFELTLGLISEEDVSGIKSADLGKVDAISMYDIDNPLSEMKLFRLYQGTKQIGGSLLIDMHGTRCLP